MKKICLMIFILGFAFMQIKSQDCDLRQFDKDSIRILFKKVNNPKILVVSAHIGDLNYTDERIMDVATNKINECLQKLNIPYVSHNGTKNLQNNFGFSQSPLDIAKKANTQFYLVINLVKNELGKRNSEAWYSTINLTLDAFDTENGMGIASTSASSGLVGSAISQTEANFQAAKQIACKGSIEIISQIIKYINKSLKYGWSYEIYLYGVRDYFVAKEFKDILTNLPEFTGEIRVKGAPNPYIWEVWYKNKRPDLIIDKIMEQSLKKSSLRTLDMYEDPGKFIKFQLK